MNVLSQRLFGSVGIGILGLSLVASGCDSDDDTVGTGGSGGSTPQGGRGGTAGQSGASQTGGTAGRGGANNGAGTGAVGVGGQGAEAGNEAGASARAGEAGEPSASGGSSNGLGGAGAGGENAAGASGDSPGGADDGPSVFRPTKRSATPSRINGLTVKAGFALNVFASSLGNARMLATRGAYVYLTRPAQGDVLRLTDADASGVAEMADPVATGLPDVHGIAFDDDQVYLATIHDVYRGTVNVSGGFDGLTPIMTDLPDGGQHYRRTLGVGPDAFLYISVGSTCDACRDPDAESATILRANLDGSARTVFANGLRNTIGFDWHPATGQLWGMDQGSDMRGDEVPPEELNRITQGTNYGWPYCFGDRVADPIIEDPPGTTKPAYCAATQPAAVKFSAHLAPIGMVFYRGTNFPEAYRDHAFVAFHGSWNRDPAIGYKVVHVGFQNGEPLSAEDFVTGFLIEDGNAYFGRPAGIAVAPDGGLLFSDDENGVVYRVAAAP